MQQRVWVDIGNKRKYRKKRILIAYGLRVIVAIFISLILVLSILGVVFLFNFFQGKEESITHSTNLERYNALTEEWLDYKQEDGSIQRDAKTIVLDPGHGGKDVGTLTDAVYEKDITIAVVKKMEKILTDIGFHVILTREEDEFIGLEDRAKIANDANADLFVSIHCNYFEKDSSVRGVECYYQEGASGGKKLAEGIIKGLKNNTKLKVRNAKAEDFSVLRNTNMTAVLIEMGYLSNKEDAKLLQDDEYQEAMALDLIECILDNM